MRMFTLPIKVLFQHCDPAGIVFYPRYFEMINQTVEAWFEDALDYCFATMQTRDNRGVPTVTITADFTAPSRLGELLEFDLRLDHLGRTSANVTITARCGEEPRLHARKTLVYIDKSNGRPLPWHDELRARMAPFVA